MKVPYEHTRTFNAESVAAVLIIRVLMPHLGYMSLAPQMGILSGKSPFLQNCVTPIMQFHATQPSPDQE